MKYVQLSAIMTVTQQVMLADGTVPSVTAQRPKQHANAIPHYTFDF